MNPRIPFRIEPTFRASQRGVVLFFALIALVAMSLAAVALIRSVDTSTIIAGNLAFKQSATSAGDVGINTAMDWLAANDSGRPGVDVNVNTNPAHAFNVTCLATRAAGALSATDPGCAVVVPGYHSSLETLDLFANATWNDTNTVLLVTNASTGNTVRYIIQRMCRVANTTANKADCLFGGAIANQDNFAVKHYANVCDAGVCSSDGLSPQIRITARTEGPRNTSSYVQAFVY
jgi:Tfp pilus assembly protein PilX